MRVKLEDMNTIPKFEPFTLTITVEDKNEAIELWHRFQIDKKDVYDLAYKNEYLEERDWITSGLNDYMIWKEIDSALERRNIKP